MIQFSKKQKLILALGAVIFGAILSLILTSNWYDNFTVKNQDINSVVTRKYLDYKQHGIGLLQMKDSTTYYILPNIYYYNVKVGDSLVKNKGSLKLKIIRKDSIFYLNLDYSNYNKKSSN